MAAIAKACWPMPMPATDSTALLRRSYIPSQVPQPTQEQVSRRTWLIYTLLITWTVLNNLNIVVNPGRNLHAINSSLYWFKTPSMTIDRADRSKIFFRQNQNKTLPNSFRVGGSVTVDNHPVLTFPVLLRRSPAKANGALYQYEASDGS